MPDEAVVRAQHRADARRQLAQAERLGDVVVGAVLETGDPVVFARARGQHDDRHMTDL